MAPVTFYPSDHFRSLPRFYRWETLPSVIPMIIAKSYQYGGNDKFQSSLQSISSFYDGKGKMKHITSLMLYCQCKQPGQARMSIGQKNRILSHRWAMNIFINSINSQRKQLGFFKCVVPWIDTFMPWACFSYVR